MVKIFLIIASSSIQRISVKARQALWVNSGWPPSFLSSGCLIGSLEWTHNLSGAAFLAITWRFTSLMGCLERGQRVVLSVLFHWSAGEKSQQKNGRNFQIPEILDREIFQWIRSNSPHCACFFHGGLYDVLPLVWWEVDEVLKKKETPTAFSLHASKKVYNWKKWRQVLNWQQDSNESENNEKLYIYIDR